MKCGQCGSEVTFSSGDRIPCRVCGSNSRAFEEGIVLTARVSDHIQLEVQREGSTVGFRESERRGCASSADDLGLGRISLHLIGKSPQGEQDTLSTCHMLVEVLNQTSVEWGAPTEGRGIDDCVAESVHPGFEPLRLQVVRAIVEAGFWRELALVGNLSKENVPAEAFGDLMAEAVKKKLCRIPPEHRVGLVLVLDANRLPAFAFDSVLDGFRETHGSLLARSGFKAVWIVGPTPSLTRRLDVANS